MGFSPDSSMIASGGDDGTVRLWDTATGQQIATVIGIRDGWAVLLADGSYKLVGEPAGSFWWVIKNVRFEPGELDDYDPTIRRVPADTPLPLPAGWHPVTPRVAPPGPRPSPVAPPDPRPPAGAVSSASADGGLRAPPAWSPVRYR
nr:WD40 repeat domain-containing protein [Frankia sp. CIT1]